MQICLNYSYTVNLVTGTSSLAMTNVDLRDFSFTLGDAMDVVNFFHVLGYCIKVSL